MNKKISKYRTIIGPTEFLYADFQDFVYPRHVHDTWAIGIIETGAQQFVTKRSKEIMPELKLCVVDPDIVHEGWKGTESGWRYRMFYPSVETIAAALNETPSVVARRGFGCFVIDDATLFRQFRQFHVNAMEFTDRLCAEGQAIDFIQALFSRHAGLNRRPPLSDNRVVSLCADYLNANVSSNVSIADLARISGVSETHVYRSFTKACGMPPHAFLLARRIELAKRLIASGGRPAEVAFQCGFADQSHLHRHFLRTVGVTPGRFARTLRG